MSSNVFPSILFLLLLLVSAAQSDVIINTLNLCTFKIWLASRPSGADFESESSPGSTDIIILPDTWKGSIWARTKCSTNASNYFSCETGDCGSGKDYCRDPPPTYPVTLLNLDFNKKTVLSYEVSLNHGFNIPIRFEPLDGTLFGGDRKCPVVDCIADISNVCPSFLVAKNQNGAYVGCYSACDALKDPKYCCTGKFTGPDCQPNEYSKTFKDLCNLAHTYPGDNDPPTYKCSEGTSFNITFCAF
ncbi:hypothetical protein Patl1_10005 [Pistacia atlantica]|uniref:Uncharacterized protein n=1 Tax=Pistacia atlantica TaxID=434234 RepID=A0ACC1A4T0_9ROSI|nr:hypothetical protein Patl1_10005 [Pistacia atlantica]